MAYTSLKRLEEAIGNFKDLDEPVDVFNLNKSEDKHDCFLTHPDMDKLYALDRGFKINNSFQHGDNLKLEVDMDKPSLMPKSLKEADPRHTSSMPLIN